MEIYTSLEDIRDKPAVVLAIGSFDGMHLGHRAILGKVRDEAERRGVESMVITFAPTPREVLSGQKEIALMKADEKIAAIRDTGIERVCIKHFDRAFARIGRDEFIERLLTYLDLRALVAGPDHHVGQKHEGGIDFLRETGHARGFDLIVVPKARYKGMDISSQLIRKTLKEGNIADVNAMLGSSYRISGTVVPGVKRGRSLGYPTLNVTPDLASCLIPAYGVYAVTIDLNGRTYPAVCNIGVRPTFIEDNLSIEVHVMNEELDHQYGKAIGIHFEHFVREERKFESQEALIEQIKNDIETCKKILTEEKCQR
ncbi:MAG: riboflavin biosynthesis protein RibF [Candidatus Marinimicrobia bacterium]|nr:riboflavin biosynthesis protein RibF [Candidatus Neomarinimicrobiota bacterium]